MSSAPREIALGCLKHSARNGRLIGGALQELTAPVVAINPDYRPTDIESLRRYGVETVLMPGVGHFEMMEDPDTFNELLALAIEQFRA
jgi:pimeloyl-ACP methyl ester carboxylesterase